MRQGSLTLAAIGALAAAACVYDRTSAPNGAPTAVSATPGFALANSSAPTTSYIVVSKGKLSDQQRQSLASLGADVTTLPELGLAFVTSADPAFLDKAGRIAGLQGVARDPEIQWTPPMSNVQMVDLDAAADEPAAAPSAFGGLETFRGVQWAPDAVHAVEAWDAGYRGAGARVAILDGGIHSTHLDIAPRLDVARSRSFVPGQPFNFDQARNAAGVCGFNDTFWHGTHVAGIVAAPGQNVGTVGIAPDATIIGVKVLHCGSGSFGQVIQGIVYAATPIAEEGAGAHIINMSLGALIARGDSGTAHLMVGINRATKYAHDRGVLVVASAGNAATNLTGGTFHLPSDANHVLSVSATAPLGWALGSTDLDRPASYTNYGNRAITFAAPGGDFALPGNQVCQKPRFPTGFVTQFCWVLDAVMAPCRGTGTSTGTYCWAAGTSMASPAVAGVAALIVGKNGPMSPQALRHALEKSADDLGKLGVDDIYGRGRVNAARAVQ